MKIVQVIHRLTGLAQLRVVIVVAHHAIGGCARKEGKNVRPTNVATMDDGFHLSFMEQFDSLCRASQPIVGIGDDANEHGLPDEPSLHDLDTLEGHLEGFGVGGYFDCHRFVDFTGEH